MATDIAFALGVLALLGNRVPVSQRGFLAAVAVMDDLGAIVFIALFYAATPSMLYLAGALAVFGVLVVMTRKLRVMSLVPYLLGGALMWFFMLKSHERIGGLNETVPVAIGLTWPHIFGAGLLGGIGFTISIFITNLAFPTSPETINAAKMSILLASQTAGVLGFAWLGILPKPQASSSTQ